MTARSTTRDSRPELAGERFDVVIIGGGINGAAIARECAKAGKRVLVVEQNDFAAGTTSRATRIIHGGLRYLEHFEIGLVRESLRERERLLAERPHLVRPLEFLLPISKDSSRSALTVRFGLWLYRRFAGRSHLKNGNTDRHQLDRWLDKGRQWSVFAYEDGQCEYPERLVAEWLFGSPELPIVTRNHTEVLEIERSDGFVTGVRLRDRMDADEYEVDCDWIVNASGPWADSICQRANITSSKPLIGGVRGTHILLPHFDKAPKSAIFAEAVDRRPIFVIPWAGQLLVGTTEVKDVGNPEDVTPNADEIQYLLRSFQRLFPAVPYGMSDIRAAFAGVRPLPYVTEKSPSSVTRRHFLIDHADDGAQHMISVVGGKLTTAASLARECARAMGINVPEPRGYEVVLPEDHDRDAHHMFREMSEFARVKLSSVKAITAMFGPAAPKVFNIIQQDDSFREQICPHTDHVVGEAVFASRNEQAMTLGDILLRRVPVALGACWSDECARTAAGNIGNALGWSMFESGRQLETFKQEYGRFMKKPEATKADAELRPAASYRPK